MNINELELATKYLKDKGYKIFETSYQCRLGSIDIIATKDKKLYFFEVGSLDLQEKKISKLKLETMRKVAAVFMMKQKEFEILNRLEYDISFDYLQVSCVHHKNAF